MSRQHQSLSGSTFGRWTVLSEAIDLQTTKDRVYRCLCVCGVSRIVMQRNLLSGRSQSCGCLSVDNTIARSITHHMTGSPEFTSWRLMRSRCADTKNARYQDYGGRGIRVCAEWRDSFEQFFADMGIRPHGHSIDRINNDGNYEPSNCRWVTPTEQANNRRPRRGRRAA